MNDVPPITDRARKAIVMLCGGPKSWFRGLNKECALQVEKDFLAYEARLTELEAENERLKGERKRCYDIVMAARCGEIDTDFRTILYFIDGGRTIEEIKARTALKGEKG